MNNKITFCFFAMLDFTNFVKCRMYDFRCFSLPRSEMNSVILYSEKIGVA